MKSASQTSQQLVIILLGILTTAVFGQGTQEKFVYQDNQRINKRNNAVAAWYDVNSRVYQGTPEQIARQFLDENRQKFGIADLSDLEFTETIKSPAGHHVAFRQRYRGIPVFRSETVVSINHENQISMVINGYAPDIRVPSTIPRATQSGAKSAVVARLQADEKTFIKQPTAILTIYQDSLEVYHLAWKVNFIAGKPHGSWQAFVDAFSGEVLSASDISLPYVNGQGKVFDPDPITALQNTALTDMNNTDYQGIQGAYDSPVTLQELNDPVGGIYRVQGRYARSEDIDVPNIAPVTSTSSSFIYNRSQVGFEEVNVLLFYRRAASIYWRSGFRTAMGWKPCHAF